MKLNSTVGVRWALWRWRATGVDDAGTEDTLRIETSTSCSAGCTMKLITSGISDASGFRSGDGLSFRSEVS